VHGSAPDIAGQGIANPVGALLSSVLMLETLGEPQAASRLRQAVLDTLASGLRTADLGGAAKTAQFTHAVCARLG
jgi:isocitrate/isopropylmalate dehydrogenase